MRDKISVVVAVYNGESTLKKCVDSLLGQSFENYEIILVNDCSKDGSLKACREYEAEFPTVRVVNNETNQGVSVTRNNGIKTSTGRYICFVDCDDYVEPDYLEKLLSYREKYNTVPVCGFVYHDEAGKSPPRKYQWSSGRGLVSLGEAFRLNSELYLTALWNKLFDNDLIKEHGIAFEPGLSMGEDLRFTVEYLKKTNTDSVYCFSDTLYHYTRLTDDTLSSRRLTAVNSGFENLKLILSLGEKYNTNARAEYEANVKRLAENFIYTIVRSPELGDEEKLELIKSFAPDFTKAKLLREKMNMYKEKIALKIKG